MRIPQTSISVLLLAALLGAKQAPAPADVKGWHGTEWGMSPAEVSKTLGLDLGEPLSVSTVKAEIVGTAAERDAADFSVIKEYRVLKVPVGDWTAEGGFFFSEFHRNGLTTLILNLHDSAPFSELRDAVKAQYGAPTSDKSQVLAGTAFYDVEWIFPHTEIDVLGDSKPLHLSLLFRRHAALQPEMSLTVESRGPGG
jgi:hypothetical protein